LIITHLQPDGQGYQYEQWETIETDVANDHTEKKEKVVKEFQQLIKTFHKELDDSSEYIVLNDSFLLKKVDFVNIKITIVNNE